MMFSLSVACKSSATAEVETRFQAERMNTIYDDDDDEGDGDDLIGPVAQFSK